MALDQTDKDDIGEIVRDIIRQETAGIREGVQSMRDVQGQQGIQMTEMRFNVRNLKSNYRRQSILLEDLESRFTTACEAIDGKIELESQVADHERRLITVESIQSLLRDTVKEHSRRLNILTG